MQEFEKLQIENLKAIEDEDIGSNDSCLEENLYDNSSFFSTQDSLEDNEDEAFEGFRTLMKMANE